MMYELLDSTVTLTSTSIAFSDPFDLGFKGLDCISAQVYVTNTTPDDQDFDASAVDTETSIITLVAHGFANGLAVEISNPGTLPTGIDALTPYYILLIDADSFQICATRGDLESGIFIEITTQGVGTNTVEVTALASGFVAAIQSNDSVNWTILGDPTAITTDFSHFYGYDRPQARYMALALVVESGQLSLRSIILGKGDKE